MVSTINKKFVQEYWEAISGIAKTPELSKKYVSDPELLGHIAFFEAAFPKYELFADDFICEEDKVVVRARFKGIHKGELMGIPPTGKTIEFPFAIIYQVTEEKISRSWLFVDKTEVLNKLDVKPSHN